MDFKLIKEKDALVEYLPNLIKAKVMAVDTETTGLNPRIDRIRLIQLAVAGMPVFIIDCFYFLPEGLGMLKDALENGNVKIYQNAKFDLQFLKTLGINPSPVFEKLYSWFV